MNHLKTLLKLGVTGGVIFLIGLLSLTQSAEDSSELGEVKEAGADIADLSNVRDGKEFARALASLGLRPRAYELNGNVMYFASGTAHGKTPDEVVDIIQDELVAYGVNSRNYSQDSPTQEAIRGVDWSKPNNGRVFEETKELANAMLKGELVPIMRARNSVRMAAVTPGQSMEDVFKYYHDRPEKIRDLLGGYRYIDVMADGRNSTDITAVWTDEEFSAAKMENRAFKPAAADLNVPVCMDCERDIKFKSLNNDEPYRSNKWRANTGTTELYNFYKASMSNRGWKEGGVQPKIDRLAELIPEVAEIQGRVLSMEKDGKSMQIAILPDEGGSEVFSFEEYKGAQSIYEARK